MTHMPSLSPLSAPLLGAVLLLGTLSGCGGGDAPGAIPRTETPLAVHVTSAHAAEGSERHVASIEADQVAALATRSSGVILRIAVDVGTRVRAGDLLLELDARDVQARVGAARAQTELAQTAFRRVENLARDRAASAQELDHARAALAAAEAALAEAEAQLAYVTIRAPFDGVITERHASAGDLATPGLPLLALATPGTRKVVAELPEHLAGQISVGMVLPVFIDGVTAPPPTARITRVVPALGAQGRTFRIEGVLEGLDPADVGRVIPGTLARLDIPVPTTAVRADRLWIPTDALVVRGQLTGVFLVEDGRARLRWIRIGQRRGESVEVLASPRSGPGSEVLRVIRNPSAELYDGRPVTVSAPAAEPIPEATP